MFIASRLPASVHRTVLILIEDTAYRNKHESRDIQPASVRSGPAPDDFDCLSPDRSCGIALSVSTGDARN